VGVGNRGTFGRIRAVEVMLMRDRFNDALALKTFIEAASNHQRLWEQPYWRAQLPEEVAEAARHLSWTWHLPALIGDCCGDGVNALPVVARLAPLQDLFLRELRNVPKEERTKRIQAWYARDKG
jgi:hypothetical protein